MPDSIQIKGARVHNLKNISITIPKNKLVVITGLSGSGKSSLAFDTIYAEGQRRYAESLSSYTRQFLELQDKPDVDEIRGLSPTIAIDQKSTSHNPRSTVGTVTEIYDYLRLLYARIGVQYCPTCAEPVRSYTKGEIIEEVRTLARSGKELVILGPLYVNQEIPKKTLLAQIAQEGISMVRLDGLFVGRGELESMSFPKGETHTLSLVVGKVEDVKKNAIANMVERGLDFGNKVVEVYIFDTDEQFTFSEKSICHTCGKVLPAIESRSFSFNSPYGACPRCTGLGITLDVDPDLVIPNPRLTLDEGAIQPWTRITGNQTWFQKLLRAVAEAQDFSVDVPVAKLPKKVMDIILYGTDGTTYIVEGKKVYFEGVIPNLTQRHAETTSEYIRKEIESYMREKICPICTGKRLKEESLSVKVLGRSIADLTSFSVEEAARFFEGVSFVTDGKKEEVLSSRAGLVARPIIKEILSRLSDLSRVGLDYITLNRSVASLSGGEAQRVRLSTQLSTALTGVIYILDEPSIGLHPQDTHKLIDTLLGLRDLGNSVLVVEHDASMMRKADYIIDVGPGAGVYGGEIIAQGTIAEIKKSSTSITGKYLTHKEYVPVPEKIHKGNGTYLQIKKASAFNLQGIEVKIPLGKLVCVTGVSGSGKSTLIIDIVSRFLAKHFYNAKAEPAEHGGISGLEYIDKVITIDQSPIGRTPRSNPATYTGVFTAIRDVFTEVPEAKLRGYDAGKFSFNVKGGGRCEACAGEGYVRIPMQFLSDVFVTCEECSGQRYNKEALEIHYQEKTIADVLSMTVEEALRFFYDIPAIADKLQILQDVGLGYVHLGQPATTLSGGEAQRVKLSTELSRRATGRTVYILDEPTTGLHFEDIKRLLKVLTRLVDVGNTVIIIEHNMDIIKSADWIIDLGPGGGRHGGRIMAEGTPSEVARMKDSATGIFLKEALEHTPVSERRKKKRKK